MLTEMDSAVWGTDTGGNAVFRATDNFTINRPVASDEDYPWSLSIAAQRAQLMALKVVASKRSPENDAWLLLVSK